MRYFVSAMGTRYIKIPAESLLSELRAVGASVEGRGGKYAEATAGREIVCEITPPNSVSVVRVYTSLAVGADQARDCGEDALRIVVGATINGKWRNALKPRRVFRTAPSKDRAGWLRQEERVIVFIERMKGHLREAYKAAATAPRCPDCEGPMATRENRAQGNTFLGCMDYPDCKGTRPTEGS